MKWTTKTALEVCFVERMRLLGEGIGIKCCWTLSMRGIVIEVAICPVSQPLILRRSYGQIIHAEIVIVSKCIAVKRRQLLRLLWSVGIGGIPKPIEIRSAEWFVFFGRARQLI